MSDKPKYDFLAGAYTFFFEKVEPETTTQYYGLGLLRELEDMTAARDALKAAFELQRAERDAYKKAKAENDERFQLERDEARLARDRLAALVGDTQDFLKHLIAGRSQYYFQGKLMANGMVHAQELDQHIRAALAAGKGVEPAKETTT